MRATITGEIRSVKFSDDQKFVDIAVLSEGGINSTRVWAFADAFGGVEPAVGQLVEVDVYVALKTGKTSGEKYLSVQGKSVTQLAPAKLRAAK